MTEHKGTFNVMCYHDDGEIKLLLNFTEQIAQFIL